MGEGIGAWMAKALGAKSVEEKKEVAEDVNNKVNPAGQKAVETDRKRKKLIDRQMEDDPSVYRRKAGED